ncbi:hypothetical protein GPECTOR_9g554 [Gonium pectorale]|uniref:Uncharacterized protein n=1 Tax=Gonium pectorale TaxID=33097 RepID=A0A150GT49_GONPE|nr:hypothetical protein GPECTOR_9g554 [Gonium pectorale]|eukprot:KXZ52510.1 hypothetical protein GPECTOR_9g554 [Gonium pectorale]
MRAVMPIAQRPSTACPIGPWQLPWVPSGHRPRVALPRRLSAAASYGPEPYEGPLRPKRERKPEWVRVLEEDADNDPDVARLLEGTEGDPDKIREKMRYALKDEAVYREGQGSEVPPRVAFRAISPMGLWVYQNADDDQSFFEYDNEDLGAGQSRMASYVHEIGEVEYQDNWARVWVDMGTADELALDVLINMLVGYSAQMAGLRSITLGGENEDWPVPPDAEMGMMGADGDYLKVGMDPMRLPEGIDEELQFMDEEGMLEGAKGRRTGTEEYGSGGYGITAGAYGATAEERELQELAARLRRPKPAAAGPGAAARQPRGYYSTGRDAGADVDAEVNPDEFEFTDEGEEAGEGDPRVGSGGGSAAAPRQWGASFVRRVRRDKAGRPVG